MKETLEMTVLIYNFVAKYYLCFLQIFISVHLENLERGFYKPIWKYFKWQNFTCFQPAVRYMDGDALWTTYFRMISLLCGPHRVRLPKLRWPQHQVPCVPRVPSFLFPLVGNNTDTIYCLCCCVDTTSPTLGLYIRQCGQYVNELFHSVWTATQWHRSCRTLNGSTLNGMSPRSHR
jgi:hypothetical protein